MRERVLVLAVAVALLGGCERKPPATANQLAEDLRQYMTELQRWEPVEKEIFAALVDVERTYYVDDDFVIRRFRSALPKLERHVLVLESYRPATPDIQAAHERYIHGWEEMGDGMEAAIEAMEAEDYVRLASAKNQVDAGKNKISAAFGELDALLAEAAPELERLRREELLAQGKDPGTDPAPTPPLNVERVPLPGPPPGRSN